MNFTHHGGGFALMMLAIVMSPGCGGRVAGDPVDAPNIFSREFILSAMENAFDWQIDHIVYSAPLPDGGFQDVSDTEWVRGAFFSGVMAAYEVTSKDMYLEAAVEISERNGWQPGPRSRHADDQCIAQTYAKIYLIERDPVMIEATVDRFEAMIADPRYGTEVGWRWSSNTCPTITPSGSALRRFFETWQRL